MVISRKLRNMSKLAIRKAASQIEHCLLLFVIHYIYIHIHTYMTVN